MIRSSGLSDLLKPGATHLSGTDEAVLRNIEACRGLTMLTRTSLGPNGKNKMVINRHGKLYVTSDAATIIKELEVEHPAAKMLVMASQMQEKEGGDATNFVIVFGGELMIQAEPLIRMGLHPSDVVAGYRKAVKKALEVLDTLSVAAVTDPRNVDEVVKFVRSAVSSKQHGYEDFLGRLVTEACISVLPEKHSDFIVDNVRTIKVLGGGVTDSRLLKGFAVLRGAEGSVKHVTDCKVAVFAAGIDSAKTETKGIINMTNKEDLLDFSLGEEKFIENMVREIAETGVRVVVSGAAVGELALHFLEKHNIMVVKIMSKFDLRRLCKAVGATPLVRLGVPIPEELGSCSKVSVDEIGSTLVTSFVQSGSAGHLSTIVLRGSTQNILDDFDRAIDDAVQTYKTLLKEPRFVAGAGAVEMELARALHRYGESQTELDQYAIKKFADALEIIPRMLLENCGANSIHAIASLQAAHEKGEGSAGVNVETGEITSDHGVYDAMRVKSWALQLAVDAAVTILRVDQLIMSKRAGGPQAPKMGPMDA